jgi:hypothetical protein
VKPAEKLLTLPHTHDLSCTISALGSAARRYTLPTLLASSDRSATDDLAVAAVAFAIQLAIDTTDHDPAELRVLERELLAKLGVLPVPPVAERERAP